MSELIRFCSFMGKEEGTRGPTRTGERAIQRHLVGGEKMRSTALCCLNRQCTLTTFAILTR